ncbi:hypothetical protein JB92DRAFT_3105902 [Gautieria morchelliformis]|nr:hypothetical protein JB92DRAFT_3105902 [Gautieria morchelliformis]
MAIKALSIEAHSVQAAPNSDLEQQIQLQTFLTRQEEVLTMTAHAINHALLAPSHAPFEQPTNASNALSRAGTCSMATGIPAEYNSGMQEVTMHEVSSATKTAVAQAVEQTSTLTSPIDVMLTAETIIQRNTQPVTPSILDPSHYPLAPDVVRHVPTSSAALDWPTSFPAELHVLSDYPMTGLMYP